MEFFHEEFPCSSKVFENLGKYANLPVIESFQDEALQKKSIRAGLYILLPIQASYSKMLLVRWRVWYSLEFFNNINFFFKPPLDHEKLVRSKINLFELWRWERLLRILQTAKVTKKQVLEHIKLDTSLGGRIRKFHVTYFSHVMQSNSLKKAIMLGMVSSKRNKATQKHSS